MIWDAIILGAGGAGLLAAATAGQAGARVLLLDHADKPGKKILISGGGRCNFTNTGTTGRVLPLGQPAFREVRSQPLHRNGTFWHWSSTTVSHGTRRRWGSCSAMVPPGRSWRCCWRNARGTGRGAAVDRDRRDRPSGRHVPRGRRSGAASGDRHRRAVDPQDGGDGIAYHIARQFGLNVVGRARRWCRFTLGDADGSSRALGCGCRWCARWQDGFREAALFTHEACPAPRSFRVSSYWSPGQAIA